MNATQINPRAKARRKNRQTPARPVTEMLLELTYLLHANKIVKRVAANPSQLPTGG